MIIDFHSHFVPRSLPDRPNGVDESVWPKLHPVVDGMAAMTLGAREFRKFEEFYWDVDKRVAGMDQDGIDLQVLTPLPEFFSYWFESGPAQILTNALNAACADMVAKAPDRFRAFGIVVLQDLDMAIAQLEEIKHRHKLSGVFIASNVRGASVAEPQFRPFFKAAAELDLPVFIHGYRPTGTERIVGPPIMASVLGVPNETTMLIASMMLTDILGEVPGLKLIFSHGGGCIGSVLDRVNAVWEKFPQMRENLQSPPLEYAKRFQYDTTVFGPEYLAYLVAKFGARCFIAGSDGPTDIGRTDLAAFVAEAGLEGDQAAAILGGNVMQLIDIATPTPVDA